MSRRASRETTMKLLYQMEINKDEFDEQMERTFEIKKMSQSDKDYVENVVKGVSVEKKNIDALIAKYARGWTLERISKIDISILRLSIYEILKRDDIPFSVSVNEAVELAKKYSSDEAGSFINGILSKFAIK